MNSWIDDSILLGSLSGVVLVFFGLWALYLLGALWRDVLWRSFGVPFQEGVEALGLSLVRHPDEYSGGLWAGWRGVILARGQAEGYDVRLALRGGLLGERLVLKARGRSGRLRVVTSLEQIADLEGWVRQQLSSSDAAPGGGAAGSTDRASTAP